MKILILLSILLTTQLLYAGENNWTNIKGGIINDYFGGGISVYFNDFGIDGYYGFYEHDGAIKLGFDYDPVAAQIYGFSLLYNFLEGETYIVYLGTGMVFHSGSTNDVYGDQEKDSNAGFAGFLGIDKYLFGPVGLSARLGFQSLEELEFQMVDPYSGSGISWGGAKRTIEPSNLFLQLTLSIRPF